MVIKALRVYASHFVSFVQNQKNIAQALGQDPGLVLLKGASTWNWVGVLQFASEPWFEQASATNSWGHVQHKKGYQDTAEKRVKLNIDFQPVVLESLGGWAQKVGSC